MKPITLVLTPDDVNVILAALADQPFKLAAGPISRLTQQLQALQNPAPAPVPAAPKARTPVEAAA